MIVDFEENKIHLVGNPNAHILVLGQSGQGKTFFSCRQIEEDIEAGKSVLILDYSGSYTDNELENNRFCYRNRVKVLNPVSQEVCWKLHYSDMEKGIDDVVDAMIASLQLTGYHQKTLIKKCVKDIMHAMPTISIGEMIDWLEVEVAQSDKNSESLPYLYKLLEKAILYEGKGISFNIETQNATECPAITILQLSDMAEMQRRFYCNLVLELLWKEANHIHCSYRYKRIILDEIQHLPIREGRALECMIKEGRKLSIGILAATQYLAGSLKDQAELFFQSGNVLIFKPAPVARKALVQLITSDRPTFWNKTLATLDIGEAVLLGKYYVNNGRRALSMPLLCRIKRREL